MRGIAVLLALPLLGAAQKGDQSVTIGTGCFRDLAQQMDRIGQICYAGQNAEFAAALTQSISRIDKMLVDHGASAAEIAAIKARNNADVSGNGVCTGDAEKMYRAMLKDGPEALRKTTDVIVTRPGRPTYGDCF